MRKLLLSAAMVLALAARADAIEIAGAWESNQGPMTITKGNDGAYTVAFKLVPGKVTGTLAGDGVFTGTWVRSKGEEACPTPRDGSAHWGTFRVTFHEGHGFVGMWRYCTETSRGANWTGARPK